MHCLPYVSNLRKTLMFFFFLGAMCNACSEKKKVPASKAADKQPTVVDAMIAQPVSLSDTVLANGTVIANETVELHPEVTGLLVYLNVPEGKFIKQGTVLARINNADLRAQIAKSKVQLQLAQANQQRLQKLLSIQGVNQADYDAVVNQVGSLQADIQYTNALIDKTVVRAPFSGVIGLRQVSPGAYVSPATIIATLQQTSRIKIDFTLPEDYSNIIKVGKKINVEIDKAREIKNTATIVAVEPQVNQQTRNLMVRALLDNGTSQPGAFVKVYVSSGTDKKAILVPTNAIIPGDQSNQIILVKNGKAVITDVKTGMRRASTAEVTSGLRQGDTVIVTGVLFARPNTDVQIRSIKTLDEFTSAGQQ